MDNKSQGSNASGAFAKAFQKTLIRTKAKILQNLGKAGKTTDEKLESHISTFYKQQAAALKLYREVTHYVSCIKTMTQASKSLYAVIYEMYEPEWVDLHAIDAALKSLEIVYASYEAELMEQFRSDLFAYTQSFIPIREKISKRGRKLLDFDNARHHFEATRTAKRPDEIKLAKATESLYECERLYTTLNTELHTELPKLHDYRVDFLASNSSKFFSAESIFHTETGKLTEKLLKLMEQIPSAEDRKVGHPPPDTASDRQYVNESGINLSNVEYSLIEEVQTEPCQMHRDSGDANINRSTSSINDGDQEALNPGIKLCDDVGNPPPSPPVHVAEDHPNEMPTESPTCATNGYTKEFKTDKTKSDDTVLLAESVIPEEDNHRPNGESFDNKIYASTNSLGDEIPVYTDDVSAYEDDSATYVNEAMLKKETGYQVMATHTYNAEDEDELSFEAGEILTVVEFDDPDDQDEGWMMGISTRTGLRGVFPENFTRRVIKRKT